MRSIGRSLSRTIGTVRAYSRRDDRSKHENLVQLHKHDAYGRGSCADGLDQHSAARARATSGKSWPARCSPTFAPACGCRWSIICPVAESTPPQKLTGSSRTSARPRAEPSTTARPSNTRPECRITPKPSSSGRLETLRETTERHINAQIAGGATGRLRRVRHNEALTWAEDRRDVGARVHNELNPGGLQ